ncbi:MAG: HU family DNA-binding protein, partial [Muribaculaceae bacterium]|nr:HU family DNA-binding protein [Muribaculaceae bacterium]
LSEQTGRRARDCEAVLRSMFQIAGNTLVEGETVKIKGLGSFKISNVEARKSVDVATGRETEIPAHKRIVFIPSKELAKAVNAPFDMFETVVINEDVLDEELMQAEAAGNELLVQDVQEQIMAEEQRAQAEVEKIREKYPVVAEESIADEDTDDSPVEEESSSEVAERQEVAADGPTVGSAASIAPGLSESVSDPENARKGGDADVRPALQEYEQADEEPVESVEADVAAGGSTGGKRGRWRWYVAGGVLALCVGVCALWWLNDDISKWGKSHMGGQTAEATVTDNAILGEANDLNDVSAGQDGMMEDLGGSEVAKVEEDSTEVAPTKPSDSDPVYDTVTDTRYLSTIAKEHYGNFNLWPYIYKENE